MDSSRDVKTTLNYYDDRGDGTPPAPVVVSNDTVTNERASVSIDVIVRDVNGHEAEYLLDSHGFQYVEHESKEEYFDDEEAIKTLYFPEIEQLLKDITGAPRVLIFDHKVRRGPSDWHRRGQNNRFNAGPLHKVHIDQSDAGVDMVLDHYVPDEADGLRKRRHQIINVWRPVQTIFKDPLAVADAGTISDSDLAEASVIKPGYRAKTWTIKPNPRHRWFYKHAQKPNEVLLIKCFDSKASVARRTPHTAFGDPEYEDRENRQSVEVRALVLYNE